VDSAESARLCAQYHIARASLLVDCLQDAERAVEPQTLETTLRMIQAELVLASAVLDSPAPAATEVRRLCARKVPER
jgi:hypothetical protein